MNEQTKQAMIVALEALESCGTDIDYDSCSERTLQLYDRDAVDKAMVALREALGATK